MTDNPNQTVLHASAVAFGGRGLLITGASGSGKSALALTLMGLGAGLIADDRTVVTRGAQGAMLSAPDTIRGLIEARGLGILHAEPVGPTMLRAVVDLDQVEAARLPDARQIDVMGQSVPLFLRMDAPHFAPALMQYLKAGRRSP